MTMAYGQAHHTFLREAVPDIQRLIDLHTSETGAGRGRRRTDIQVVTRSAIVMTCASWEAFCEDLASEALRKIAIRTKDPADLPAEIKKTLKKSLLAEKDDLAIWSIAGRGWKDQLKLRADMIVADEDRSLNTPKHRQVKSFFRENVGIGDITQCWSWVRCQPDTACRKLDEFVALRGSIAHRRAPAGSVYKREAVSSLDLVQRLASCTAKQVDEFLAKTTGRGLIRRDINA
ncbi:HEPN domain-containing protein [Plantactinospora sonchi]|uniref:HEPN domain-containing protein n=1 Tax=Plantactinospora sonchi TaxID=1544735 RepID=A0ABU7RUD7_9ACTN